MQYRHFAFRAAQEVIKRFPNQDAYVVEAGVTPSGKIHLGNFNDMVIADAVLKALKELGYEAKGFLVVDSRDPFRQPPEFAPKSFKREANAYIGKPLEELPDPWGCHNSYAEHFIKPLEEVFPEYSIEIKIKWAKELHRAPGFIKLIEKVVERREKIRNVVNEVRRKAGHVNLYPSGWIPYRPRCEKCGRIDEKVEPLEVINGHLVRYKCGSCGHEGIADIRKAQGKPPWRIDWPLRWIYLNVHFEPLGKDHMASGSGYDTGSAVAREVFGRQPPVPVFYDFIYWVETKNGEKIYKKFSKRRGIGLGVDEWLKYAPPEVLRFQILKRDVGDIFSEALSHWDFDFTKIPDYVEEFDRYENTYFEIIEKKKQNWLILDTYKLTMYSKEPPRKPRRVSYKTLAKVAIWMRDLEDGILILKKQGKLKGLEEWEIADVKKRLIMASNWVREVGIENILPQPSEIRKVFEELEDNVKKAVIEVLGEVKKETTPERIQERVKEISVKYGLTTRKQRLKVYRSIYRLVLGEDSGPPLKRLLSLPIMRERIEKLCEILVAK